MTEQQKLRELLENSSHIVFFGGAGVSTESGVPDFRSEDGLYGSKQAKTYPYPPETMLSHSFFKRHTEQFFEYYFDRMVYPQAKPNAAHYALAELEAQGKLSILLRIKVKLLNCLSDYTLLIICIVNRKMIIISKTVYISSQNAHTRAVECRYPYALCPELNQAVDTIPHLLRCLICKGNCHDIPWIYSLFLNQICNTMRQHTRFS